MSLLITHIKGLLGTHAPGTGALRGADLAKLPMMDDAWLFLENGLIKDFGPMSSLESAQVDHSTTLAAKGYVLPAWADSHTHLVFAASREEEFVMKIKGNTYEDIARAGGGIANSARKLEQATEDDLFESAWQRLMEVMSLGTGSIEIKSGYGLSTDAELKMLRVIRRLKERAPIPVKATFLGAHSYPPPYREDHESYLRILIDELLPVIAAERLADYMDVFCEQGFFSVDETSRLLEAAAKYGLKPKIHANQLSSGGAVQAGIQHGALSVDHLEEMDNDAIASLAGSATIGTMLPSCSLFLGIPFAPARRMIEAGAALALASDFNPGSTPSGNMNLVVSLACMRLKMLPEEAINAATLNGAAAMELDHSHGSITRDKAANLILTKNIPSVAYLPYAFGSNLLDKVIINGKVL